MSERRPYLQWSEGAAGPVLAALGSEGEKLSWQDEALCAEVDPELFFPAKGGSVRSAKKVCSACPVRTPCLAYAIEHDERFGIYGGKSERERRRIRRERREVAA